jgi:hypothetical protein
MKPLDEMLISDHRASASRPFEVHDEGDRRALDRLVSRQRSIPLPT